MLKKNIFTYTTLAALSLFATFGCGSDKKNYWDALREHTPITTAQVVGQKQNISDSTSLNIYFQTAKFNLEQNDSSDIASFLNQSKDLETLTIEGHADERGGIEYNQELALSRAKQVATLLKTSGYDGNISIVSYGKTRPLKEGKNNEAYAENRCVILSIKHPIQRGLEVMSKEPSDYLIDGSSSMGMYVSYPSITRWSLVKKHKFPKESRTYVFPSYRDTTIAGSQGDSTIIKTYEYSPEVIPPKDENTPLWETMCQVLEFEKIRNNSLTIFTDGDNNYGSRTWEDVLKIAKIKGIKLNMIGVGSSDTTNKIMHKLSKETNGSWYTMQQTSGN